MKPRHLAAGALAASLLFALPAATVDTAEAAAPAVLKVCNSADSIPGSWIVAYNGGNTTPKIYRGRCRDIYNGDKGARVLSEWAYRVKPAGGRYGPRHSRNVASNPPNVSKVYYKTVG
jgi:hypothetical protein